MGTAEWTSEAVGEVIASQQDFIAAGGTRTLEFRRAQLLKLKEAVKSHESEIREALLQDLGKSEFEGYMTEIGYLYDTISYTLKHLKRWMRPQRVKTPLVHFGSKSAIYREPYGSVLIIGPFNYPFMLMLDPLVGALAAGNCAVLKPSEYTPHVSAVIAQMVSAYFSPDIIQVIEGGKETTSELIHAPFDLIFFTGSPEIGKVVMKAAAERLVPVVLELGGKSPCIVDADADLELAAKRIIWGKFVNMGQTCVAPDYVLAHRNIKQALIKKLKQQITTFYGEIPRKSPDLGRIVNERHWDRLNGLLDAEKVVAGGDGNREELYLAPTIMDGVTWEDPVMQEEIFGPILPILEMDHLDQAIQMIHRRPKPLALYLFTKSKYSEREVLGQVSFGGGCVNDVLMHLATPYLPFGGVGNSGMGSYHGHYSFEAFSHRKGVLHKSTSFNPDMMYPPYTPKKLQLVRRFLK